MQMTEVKTGVFSRGTHTKVSAGYVLRDAPCVYNSTVFKRTTAGVKNIGRVDPFRTPLPSPSFGNKLLGISVIIFAVLKGLSARSMPIQCGIPLQCGTGIPAQCGAGIKPLHCGTGIPLQCGTNIKPLQCGTGIKHLQCGTGIPLQCGTGIPLRFNTGMKHLQCGTGIKPLQCGNVLNLYSVVYLYVLWCRRLWHLPTYDIFCGIRL